MKRYYIIGAMMLLLVACSKEDGNPEKSKSYENLSYGKSPSQKLDLSYPAHPDEIKQPIHAVLFIHGGGWEEGDKNVYAGAVSNTSQNMNVLAATMNYRMFGEGANADDMLADIHAALQTIQSQAKADGVKLQKILLMGASAGGHLALLYTYKNHHQSPIPIAFCVGQSAPSDFTDPALYAHQQFGPYLAQCATRLSGTTTTIQNYPQNTNQLLKISPIHYVKQDVPPTLLAHGAKDVLVPLSNATRLKKALTDAGAVTELFIYKNSGHELESDWEVNTAFFNKMAEYISIYMKN